MLSFNLLVIICILYTCLMFCIAFWADRRAERGKLNWLKSPWVYTLSLSVYCTAWTFYGAVGYAVRSGAEFVVIYLGPSLIMIGWWWSLRRILIIAKAQRATSIADLISSRYGKSSILAALITIIAVIGTTPYIALQLQSITQSLWVFSQVESGVYTEQESSWIALGIAIGLSLFTVLFGTRSIDINERHHGVIMAIALEALVKIIALLAVGIFVVWGISDGPQDIMAQIISSEIIDKEQSLSRWSVLIVLSACAFLTLPRMFQVLIVENSDIKHLYTASWAFPTYVMLMSLFVIPIAVVGLKYLPSGSNPDMFVLTIPLAFEQHGLAILSFLGGFSAATSMIVIASIALSTMVSNHLVMPIWLQMQSERAVVSGDVRKMLLFSRRIAIFTIIFFGYLYLKISGGSEALSSMGLIAFVGVVQFLPAIIGGLLWRGATRVGAILGATIGFIIWGYTLFLPSFGLGIGFDDILMSQGPWGIGWLRPQGLLGVSGIDPLVHAVVFSLLFNSCAFIFGSLISFPSPIERVQAAQFVNLSTRLKSSLAWSEVLDKGEELLAMTQRTMGAQGAQSLFRAAAHHQGKEGYIPDITPEFLELLERELSGYLGSAMAHAMLVKLIGGGEVSVDDLMAAANEAAQLVEYSSQLELKSEELHKTAGLLKDANQKLKVLSEQKDEFLAHISHELRTPMTSIMSFSAILRAEAEEGTLDESTLTKFSTIINDEAERMTRLLGGLLDLSRLQNTEISATKEDIDLVELLEQAISYNYNERVDHELTIHIDNNDIGEKLYSNKDQLFQVFLNIISNAQKYCDAKHPRLKISAQRADDEYIYVDFIDNGTGIAIQDQAQIFEKFTQLKHKNPRSGAGLGLNICKHIMQNLGGDIAYLPAQDGAAFRIKIPRKS